MMCQVLLDCQGTRSRQSPADWSAKVLGHRGPTEPAGMQMENRTDVIGVDVVLVVGHASNTDICEWCVPESTVNSS